MKKLLTIIIFFIFIGACKKNLKKTLQREVKIEVFVTNEFELVKPLESSEAVLILFGGFGENPAAIKREFKILNIAKKNKIAVLLMNYSNKLWLEEKEKYNLAKLLQETLEKHQLETKDIFIGGFSSGGVVSLHISNFIIGMKEFYIDPKGVFIADSPIDLLELYKTSEENIKRNFSEIAMQESSWILNLFNEELGNPKDGISKYEKYSVYTSQSNCIQNLRKLKNIKIRLYTEPDFDWWKKNRNVNYEQTNAFYIKKLSKSLKNSDFNHVEYISTTNKGYRSDGKRHPHSWSIIDTQRLIDWMLKK